MSKLGETEFEFNKENDNTGIEILDMHRKIVKEVSKIKFDESIIIVEHIPKNDVLGIHLLSLKGTNN